MARRQVKKNKKRANKSRQQQPKKQLDIVEEEIVESNVDELLKETASVPVPEEPENVEEPENQEEPENSEEQDSTEPVLSEPEPSENDIEEAVNQIVPKQRKTATKKAATPKTTTPKPVPKKTIKKAVVEAEKSVITKKKLPPKVNKRNVETTSEDETTKTRMPRRKVTYATHMQRYEELLTLLDSEIERKSKEQEKGVRSLRTIRKMVKDMEKDVNKIVKRKKVPNSTSKKVSGFLYMCRISDELADFLQLDKGTTINRNEVTNALSVYCHYDPTENRPHMLKWKHLNPDGKRNLQSTKNRMILVPDKKLSALLNYDQYKEDVKKGKIMAKRIDKETGELKNVKVQNSELRYCTMQRLIKHHFLETLKETE